MSKLTKSIPVAALCAALLMLTVVSANAQTPPPATKFADEFFVVSSVDRTHNALILLAPTEIAQVFQVTDKTQFFDENGKSLKLGDLRAGDTIFVTSHTNSDGTFTLDRVHKGEMTVAQLRLRYLPGLPANAGLTSQTAPKPKSSAPASNAPKSNSAKPGTAKPAGTKPNSSTPAKPKSGSSAPTNPKSNQTSH
ncbi:MAG TPA: hypothetical protein VGZ48_10125 [Candidatus Acidoferrales bacterium]|jgi:hypothetical protein|nr:hypothetical protein [Candidatus Acidoferrales bacterium]